MNQYSFRRKQDKYTVTMTMTVQYDDDAPTVLVSAAIVGVYTDARNEFVHRHSKQRSAE